MSYNLKKLLGCNKNQHCNFILYNVNWVESFINQADMKV
jgi:hypothetical protein